ncbi:hypothetical protein BDZ90DRAFT_273584 [Jaminaea rosea]|uniref:AD domain-containing protein n=1 Tax=Jaminaea rosea TaxID=1569628 RepID=A0A316UXG8_9BASI|nr:hypothetical protein BDZ90DRAFT_273584 [Jaminaea rosea]PWN29684.1 hypothetical protein BDZ90DRAFT_273584 [Jaminaea rosea]
MATPATRQSGPPAGSSSPATGPSSPSPASAKQDLTSYLGLPLRLTLSSPPNTQVSGLLFSHDVQTGLVVLETGYNPAAPPPYPATAAAAPSSQRTNAVIAAQGGSSSREPTGFKLIKERCIKSVEVLPNTTAEAAAASSKPVNGAPSSASSQNAPVASDVIFAKTLSPITPIDASIAERREAAASREAQLRASKIGVGVTEFAQEIFEGLSKTMPCRWHQTQIVIMDEMMLAEPYDLPSLRVPRYSQSLLERLAADDEKISQADLPQGEDVSRAKAKARSWERVCKVLEGERRRAAARRAAQGGGL